MATLLGTLATLLRLLRWELRALLRSRVNRPSERVARGTVVLVAPAPPPVNGGVFRPLSLIKYADASGWRASMVTLQSGSMDANSRRLLDEFPEASSIVRVSREHNFSWRLSRRVGLDGGIEHIPALVRAIVTAAEERGASMLVASGPPFLYFVAVRYAAAVVQLPFVVDYRDEWGENPFGFVSKSRAARYLERRCLLEADLTVFTTDSQRSLSLASVPRPEGTAAVVANGVDPQHLGDTLPEESDIGPSRGQRLSLAFAGVIGGHTPLQPFVQALEACDSHCTLNVIGPTTAEERLSLPECERVQVKFRDAVPADKVVATLTGFHLLLLVTDENFRRYIPGKLYYYLATSRPILVYGHEGETSSIVTKLGAGMFVAKGDLEGLAEALGQLAGAADKWNTLARREFVAQHTRVANAQRFYERIDAIRMQS